MYTILNLKGYYWSELLVKIENVCNLFQVDTKIDLF